ncbi:MAG: hypothetical protein FJX44_00110 [Alphaproteobacteria bacterium]|nr:hypothetical protein [Alphaproteobacteria bacterium]
MNIAKVISHPAPPVDADSTATMVAEMLREEGEEPTGTPADLLKLANYYFRCKRPVEGYRLAARDLSHELSSLKSGTPQSAISTVQKISRAIRKYRWVGATYISETKIKLAVALGFPSEFALREILRSEGVRPTGTDADIKKIRECLSRLKEDKSAYQATKQNVLILRAVTKRPLTSRQIEALRDKPSVFVASLVKSGTKYMNSTVGETLRYPRGRSLYSGRFPENAVRQDIAEDFAVGGLAGAGHLQASPENMRLLNEVGIRKLVLHVRDPRAALYSYMHYFRRRSALLSRSKQGFESLGDEQQIDYHIDHFYMDSLRWLTEWADYLAIDPPIKVLVTDHGELVSDEDSLFWSIFAWYGVRPRRLRRPPKDVQRNFRSGSTDEWRASMSPQQIERATSLIPKRLFDRFGWTP